MRFLWKSQLKKERGKFLPEIGSEKKNRTRKERFVPRTGRFLLWSAFLLWIFFLGTIVYLTLFSPYLSVTTWQVDGLELVNADDFHQRVDQELAQTYFGFLPRNTFFLIQPTALERLLQERFPLIRDIVVRRIFPDRLSITVQERTTLLLWCSADRCAQILEDGSTVPTSDIFQAAENREHTLTLVDESGQPLPLHEHVFDRDFIPVVVALREGLQNRFGLGTDSTLRVISRFANDLRMRTTEGWEVYFNTQIAPERSLSALGLILDGEIPRDQTTHLQYIDVRTENRVFYRYQDGTVQQTVTVQTEGKAVKESSSGEKKK